MSTLYKQEGYQYWYYQSYYRGKRLRKSTGFSQKYLAQKLQQKWDWKLANDDLGFYGKSQLVTVNIDEFIDEHLKLRERISTNTYNTAKSVTNRLNKYLKGMNIKSIMDITITVLNGYIDYLDCSAKTKHNHMMEIKQMLKSAVIENLLPNNPADHVTLPRVIKSDPHRYLDHHDLEVIFKYAGPWRLYFEFLYRTGLRAGDVAMLTYGHIDRKRKVIVSLIRKSRKVHEVPLSDVLFEMIDSGDSTAPIFPTLYANTDRRLNDNLKKPRTFLQGILQVHDKMRADLHSFRTTFNNTLRDLGLSIEDRQVLLAHSSSQTTKIYTHPNLQLAFDYINQIPEYS